MEDKLSKIRQITENIESHLDVLNTFSQEDRNVLNEYFGKFQKKYSDFISVCNRTNWSDASSALSDFQVYLLKLQDDSLYEMSRIIDLWFDEMKVLSGKLDSLDQK